MKPSFIVFFALVGCSNVHRADVQFGVPRYYFSEGVLLAPHTQTELLAAKNADAEMLNAIRAAFANGSPTWDWAVHNFRVLTVRQWRDLLLVETWGMPSLNSGPDFVYSPRKKKVVGWFIWACGSSDHSKIIRCRRTAA